MQKYVFIVAFRTCHKSSLPSAEYWQIKVGCNTKWSSAVIREKRLIYVSISGYTTFVAVELDVWSSLSQRCSSRAREQRRAGHVIIPDS